MRYRIALLIPDARTPSPLSRFDPATARHMEHCASAVLGQKSAIISKAGTMESSSTASWFLNGFVMKRILKAIVGRDHEIHDNPCYSNVKPNWKTETHQFAVLFNFPFQPEIEGNQYKWQNHCCEYNMC